MGWNQDTLRERNKLHSTPFNGVNNRKQTISRIKSILRVQNVACYGKPNSTKILSYKKIEKMSNLEKSKLVFLGFKYIFH